MPPPEHMYNDDKRRPKDDPAYLDKVLPADFKALSGLTYRVGRDPDECEIRFNVEQYLAQT
jgi:hypothetical protein